MPNIDVVSVFAAAVGGGNPVPIVTDADGLTDQQMQAIAAEHGLEIGVVTNPKTPSNSDLAMRYWVPKHEMSMCGHATIGAIWVLCRTGTLTPGSVTVDTAAGLVRARITEPWDPDGAIEISQPPGLVKPIEDRSQIAALANVLRVDAELIDQRSVVNAATTRVKTLVPVASEEVLDSMRPRFELVERWCAENGSTGIYPYAPVAGDDQAFAARQFPQSSGYPEDPATGIAAAALAFGLLTRGLVDIRGPKIRVRQGFAMNRPSEISVRFDDADTTIGCWVGGTVQQTT